MANTSVALKTSLGDITLEVNGDKAPISAENFLDYVKAGFYDGTIFHRVIPDFMAQAGGFTADFTQKETRSEIKNEADNGLKNCRGAVAMARTPDPDSASAQFFINYKDNSFLDFSSKTPDGWGYAVFAQVTEGMDIIDKMATLPTQNKGGHQDVPQTPIIIEQAQIID